MILYTLLTLIFIRPFIPSLSYPVFDANYCLSIIVLSLALIKSKKEILRSFPGQAYLLLFFFALTLSAFSSLQPYKSLQELPKFISYFFIFLVAYYANEQEKKKIIFTLIVTATCVSLFAIYWFYFGSANFLEYMQNQNTNYPFAQQFIARHRAFMPFVLPSMLAGYLIIALPLSIGYLFTENLRRGRGHCQAGETSRSNLLSRLLRPLRGGLASLRSRYAPRNDRNKHILLTLAILLIAFALLLTKSAGAFLSIFLALLIFMLFSGLINEKTTLVLLILQLAFISVFILRGFKTEYFTSSVFSVQNRLIYWRNTLAVITKHPFRGTGLGNLPFVQAKFAHNSYLQIWAEAGILGIVSFSGFLFKSFKSLQTKRLTTNKLYAGLAIAHLGFLIHNFIDFSFFLPEVCIFWWIIIALFLSSPDIIKER